MARVTWRGEDEIHNGNAGPSFTTCFGVKFPKGEAVDVSDPAVVKRAKGNPFFKVEGAPGRPAKVKEQDGDENKG